MGKLSVTNETLLSQETLEDVGGGRERWPEKRWMGSQSCRRARDKACRQLAEQVFAERRTATKRLLHTRQHARTEGLSR
jgi:hypothetical protein